MDPIKDLLWQVLNGYLAVPRPRFNNTLSVFAQDFTCFYLPYMQKDGQVKKEKRIVVLVQNLMADWRLTDLHSTNQVRVEKTPSRRPEGFYTRFMGAI